MTQGVFAMHELWYAGVDPNEMRFKRGGCFDVGVECGGWGRVILEALGRGPRNVLVELDDHTLMVVHRYAIRRLA